MKSLKSLNFKIFKIFKISRVKKRKMILTNICGKHARAVGACAGYDLRRMSDLMTSLGIHNFVKRSQLRSCARHHVTESL